MDPLEQRAERMREILERERDDEATWFGLGQTLLALGRAEEAAAALREAVRLRPDYTAAHRDLGRALLEAGRRDEALAVLARGERVAEETRDLQTGREIAVLLRRASPGAAAEEPAGGPAPAAGGEGGARAPQRASLAARRLAREALRQLANDRTERAI